MSRPKSDQTADPTKPLPSASGSYLWDGKDWVRQPDEMAGYAASEADDAEKLAVNPAAEETA